MRACDRVGSTVDTGARLTPGAVRSTRKSPRPRSPSSDARATTTAKSATSPSSTGTLAPLIRPPPARTDTLPGVATRGPSDRAKHPIAWPWAILGSQRFFCASLPARSRASAAR